MKEEADVCDEEKPSTSRGKLKEELLDERSDSGSSVILLENGECDVSSFVMLYSIDMGASLERGSTLIFPTKLENLSEILRNTSVKLPQLHGIMAVESLSLF